MKHARPDYDRIQDPNGKIPEKEPVFLLRAQDRYAAQIVSLYADTVEFNGGDDDIVAAARAHAQAMKEWPIKKEPDL